MIQRTQSICLLVTIIALITMILVPVWPRQVMVYSIYAWYLQKISSAGGSVDGVCLSYALIGLLAFAAIGIATYELFKYNDRAMQLKLGTLNTLVMIVFLVCTLHLAIQEEIHVHPDAPGKYKFGFLLPVVALASNILANRCIRKDKKLVQDADRLR